MWTVVNSVGKLVEARLTSADSGEVGACLGEIAKLVALAQRPVVGILDMSQVRVLGRDDADRFVAVMRGDNPRVERTAIVVNADQLLGLQMERLVRAAALPRRQVFRLATPAVTWLAEVLSFEEVARARAFMNE